MARTKLVIALALASLILSPIAGALGLGTIEIRSALNQPLDARIKLQADAHELETLVVRLASAEAFQRAGIDRPFLLTRLKFEIVSGDEPYVRVFTDQPVKEPFLDFLVEADWARGRLVREFTLLLDPPVFGGAELVAPRVVAAPTSSSALAAQATTQPSTFAASASAVTPAAEATSLASTNRYGPVSANDTLWKIAQEVRPNSSISINQTMVALLRANPNAFIDGDMNRLKRGSILEIPDAATMAAIGGAEADQEARSQLQRWRQRTAATQPSGRLQVVAPEQASSSDSTEDGASSHASSVEDLQRELTIFRENSLSLEAENEELKAQVEGLKQELAQLERLINLSADRPVAVVDGDSPAAESLEDAPLAEGVEPGAADDAAEVVDESAAAESVEPVQQAAPASLPLAPPADTPGFLDDPRNLSMLGGLVLALLGLMYLIVRRRRAAGAEQLEADTSVPVAVSAEEEPELGASLDLEAEVESDDSDEAEALNVLDILSEDSDALSEASLYLGHGRYEQAREVLEQALQSEPEHKELRLKLLETLALMQEEDEFADHAGMLRAQVDESDEAWQRVLEMGRDFLPTHPMFATDVDEQVSLGEVAFDIDMPGGDSEVQELAPVAAAADLEEAEDDFSLDFDLPEAEAEEVAAVEPAAEAEFPALEDDPFQPEEKPELGLTDIAPLDETPGAELSDLQFDDLVLDEADQVLEFTQADENDEPDAGGDRLEELDEVGVKLNLARAYVDLGDHEGARSLLDEVLAEGSNQQREEAEDLLGQLA